MSCSFVGGYVGPIFGIIFGVLFVLFATILKSFSFFEGIPESGEGAKLSASIPISE